MLFHDHLMLAFFFFLSLASESIGLHSRPRMVETRQSSARTLYNLGVGKADIMSGPVEYGFMGYAALNQKGTGLRQRVWARAFIIGSTTTPSDRFVYIICDLASGDTAIRKGVMEALENMYPGVYGENVAVVGTHSHSSSGGYFNYLLPQVTVLGFAPEVYNPIVQGIAKAVQRAHESLAPGYLTMGKGRVENANINRSLYAYLNNPAEERAQYGDDSVDKEMTVLGFEKKDGTKIGMLNWFAVHGTSMYNNNTLITGDNKGLASYLFEKDHPGMVAGFSQANVGDTSPNTLGAVCQDTGLPCKFEDSTCNGKNELCMGRGPAFPNDTNSCKIIAQKQKDAAEQIWNDMYQGNGGTAVVGDNVKWVHQYVDFGAPYTFTDTDGKQKSTCKAALGYSFAAGTTDGPGQFDFKQSDSGKPDDPLWDIVRDILKTPSQSQIDCHKPKPILLDVGEMTAPYQWTPNIVENQMFMVGSLCFIIASGEATTMSGRRWRNAVSKALVDQGVVDEGTTPWVVLGGPANTYGHYIATPEEYAIQRYEGASTLYGQWTLNAYIDVSVKNVKYLKSGATISTKTGPLPPINTAKSFNLNTAVVADNPPIGKKWGDVLTQPSASYAKGTGVASAVFVGANPRNNLHTDGTYLTVDQKQSDGSWKTIRTDNDWTTTLQWTRTNLLFGYSTVKISWEIEPDAPSGTFRLSYNGDWKALLTGKVSSFTAYSNPFTVS